MGGGSAGKIQYPDYIVAAHSQFLDHDGGDVPVSSITDAFNTAYSNNPFIGEAAYDPDPDLTRAYNEITAFKVLAEAINPENDHTAAMLSMADAVDSVINTDYISSPIPTVTIDDSTLAGDTDAFAAAQNNILENTILPPWKAGMHNINAVTSSAFVIGEAILRGMMQADVTKYASGVRTQITAKNAELNADFIKQRQDMILKFNVQRNEMIRQTAESVIQMMLKKNDIYDSIALRATAYTQVHISAKYDETDANLTIGESDAKWEIGLFQPVAALIGAMAAGGGAPGARRPSRVASIAGGTISGASAGSAFGGYGALAGAVIGAGLGYLSTT